MHATEIHKENLNNTDAKVIAYSDGQNLHLGTTKCNHCAEIKLIPIEKMKYSDCSCGTAWQIDYQKFRIYLKSKYSVTKAYYYFGHRLDQNNALYANLQDAGFVVKFKEHTDLMKSKKKGNIDMDILFDICNDSWNKKGAHKVLLVSNDGDYYKVVKELISQNKFEKILFPKNKLTSSLYKNNIADRYFQALDQKDIKRKIKHT